MWETYRMKSPISLRNKMFCSIPNLFLSSDCLDRQLLWTEWYTTRGFSSFRKLPYFTHISFAGFLHNTRRFSIYHPHVSILLNVIQTCINVYTIEVHGLGTRGPPTHQPHNFAKSFPPWSVGSSSAPLWVTFMPSPLLYNHYSVRHISFISSSI